MPLRVPRFHIRTLLGVVGVVGLGLGVVRAYPFAAVVLLLLPALAAPPVYLIVRIVSEATQRGERIPPLNIAIEFFFLTCMCLQVEIVFLSLIAGLLDCLGVLVVD
jgi:hypothetical protein